MPWESSAEGDGAGWNRPKSGLKLEVPLETKCRPGIPARAENQSSQLWWARASASWDSIDGRRKTCGRPVDRRRQASEPNSTSTGVGVLTIVLNFNLPFDG